MGEATACEPVKAMYVTGPSVPPVEGSGSMPRLLAMAYDASPMMFSGPSSPKTP